MVAKGKKGGRPYGPTVLRRLDELELQLAAQKRIRGAAVQLARAQLEAQRALAAYNRALKALQLASAVLQHCFTEMPETFYTKEFNAAGLLERFSRRPGEEAP